MFMPFDLFDRVFRQVFTEGETVVGLAIREALRKSALTGVTPSLLRTYQLLGDPALELQLAPGPMEPEPKGCGTSCGEG